MHVNVLVRFKSFLSNDVMYILFVVEQTFYLSISFKCCFANKRKTSHDPFFYLWKPSRAVSVLLGDDVLVKDCDRDKTDVANGLGVCDGR